MNPEYAPGRAWRERYPRLMDRLRTAPVREFDCRAPIRALILEHHPTFDGVRPMDEYGIIPSREEFQELVEACHRWYDRQDPTLLADRNRRQAAHAREPGHFEMRPQKKGQPGFVYVLAGPNGYFKLGCSKHPQRRCREIARATGLEMTLVHQIAVDQMYAAETAIMTELEYHHVTGEWFRLPDEALVWLRQITHWTGERA